MAATDDDAAPPAAVLVRLFRPCLEKNLEATVRASSCLSPSANMMPFLCRNKRMQLFHFILGGQFLLPQRANRPKF